MIRPGAATPQLASGPFRPGSPLTLVAVTLAAAFSLSRWATPPIALSLGVFLAFTVGNPAPERLARAARGLLQVAVVGLGFGIPLDQVFATGLRGMGYTAVGILTTMALGLALGRWLAVNREVSLLITSGTGICGGSAIAAVGPVIGAAPEAMTISLGTVFLLNAVALYLFPPIGHALGLSQHQFALWAALGIHDTSSVVGAASAFGPAALHEATVLKLTRALWIVPLTFAVGRYFPRDGAVRRPRFTWPWFIGLFLVAALLRLAFSSAVPAFDLVTLAARHLLALTLFIIGLGLAPGMLRSVGIRPLLHGVLLWAIVGGLTLLAVLRLASG